MKMLMGMLKYVLSGEVFFCDINYVGRKFVYVI